MVNVIPWGIRHVSIVSASMLTLALGPQSWDLVMTLWCHRLPSPASGSGQPDRTRTSWWTTQPVTCWNNVIFFISLLFLHLSLLLPVRSFVIQLFWRNDTVVLFPIPGCILVKLLFYYFDTVSVLTSEKYYFVWQRRKKCQKYCSKYSLFTMRPYCLLTCTYNN